MFWWELIEFRLRQFPVLVLHIGENNDTVEIINARSAPEDFVEWLLPSASDSFEFRRGFTPTPITNN